MAASPTRLRAGELRALAADGPGSQAWRRRLRAKQGRVAGVAITAYVGVKWERGETANTTSRQGSTAAMAGSFPRWVGAPTSASISGQTRSRVPGSSPEQLRRFMAAHGDRFGEATVCGKTRTWQLDGSAGARRPRGPLPRRDAALRRSALGGGIWQALHTGVSAGRQAARLALGRHDSNRRTVLTPRSCGRTSCGQVNDV